jgi:hypothetical protein
VPLGQLGDGGAWAAAATLDPRRRQPVVAGPLANGLGADPDQAGDLSGGAVLDTHEMISLLLSGVFIAGVVVTSTGDGEVPTRVCWSGGSRGSSNRGGHLVVLGLPGDQDELLGGPQAGVADGEGHRAGGEVVVARRQPSTHAFAGLVPGTVQRDQALADDVLGHPPAQVGRPRRPSGRQACKAGSMGVQGGPCRAGCRACDRRPGERDGPAGRLGIAPPLVGGGRAGWCAAAWAGRCCRAGRADLDLARGRRHLPPGPGRRRTRPASRAWRWRGIGKDPGPGRPVLRSGAAAGNPASAQSPVPR